MYIGIGFVILHKTSVTLSMLFWDEQSQILKKVVVVISSSHIWKQIVITVKISLVLL